MALEPSRKAGVVILSNVSAFHQDKGKIDALRFLEFIAGYRGVPVLYDSDALKQPKEIEIVNDNILTYEIAKAILELNGFTVFGPNASNEVGANSYAVYVSDCGSQ